MLLLNNQTLNRLGLVLITLCCFSGLRAQEETGKLDFIKFEWSNTTGTTRFNPVYFLQDSRGLMWMATSLGVVSFDGYSFRLFSPGKYQLSSSKIVRLAEDMHGNIWIMGFRNSRIVIDVLNPKTETSLPLHNFLRQEQPVEIPMRDEYIYIYNIEGKIWVGTLDAGYLYDGQWRQVYQQQNNQSAGGGWCPAKSGFWIFSQEKKRIYLENSAGKRLDSISDVRYFWLDNTLNLWTNQSDNDRSFRQLTAEDGRIFTNNTDRLPVFGWASKNIVPKAYCIPYRNGYSWWLDQSDLYLSRSDGSGAVILNREFPEISPTSNFYFDRDGGLWTANLYKIIHLTSSKTTGFKTLLTDKSLDRSIRGMTQIGNQLYVNSYKGDCIIQLDNLAVSKNDICNGQGLALMPDRNGFWVGGHGGNIAFVEPGRRRTTYPLNRLSDVTSFLHCSTGILAGTSNGLYKINVADKSVEPTLFLNAGIYYMYKNDRGIWLCTTNGLYLIDEQGSVMAHYLTPGTGLQYDRINYLYEDSNGDFWLATNGAGLIRWSVEKGLIKNYSESEGLSNNDIHAVYDDGMGYLWLPSNFGLMRLHKDSGRIRVFFKRDGIADSEFNAQSHYRAADGQLFFGGVNGITAFYPKDIPLSDDDYDTPTLRLMEARTFQIKSGNYVNHLGEIDEGIPVMVTPEDDYLDIRVSPLVYEDINQIRYSWKIDGYSDNWIQQESPLIRLHNLPYGEYKMKIRYSLQGNTWSKNEITIPVLVTRPFYLAWPFLSFVVLLLLAGAWLTGNWRAKNLRKANQKLEAEVKNRTQKIESDKQIIEDQSRELRSLDEMKSRFFINITHELRTPLTLILGPVQGLLKSDRLNEKDRDSMNLIQRNAGRLLNLVEELLDLSKMEANKLVLAEKPVQLYLFLARIMASFLPYAEHRRVTLKLKYNCPNNLALMMDEQKWDKILNNLLNNALKFTPGGGTIIIETEIREGNLALIVEDTGTGIHPDDLPYIFDRYYQARNAESTLQGGAGIGLSLCREYMKLFGGDISVQSTVGTGSKFTLSCPLKPAPDTDPDMTGNEITFSPAGEFQQASAAHNPTKRTVLLVEDDRDMSDYVQSILSPDYNLICAENGQIALHLLENNTVDLVLSDLMMPEMDGMQLLKTVRERYLDIPFIILTARADAPDRLHALTLGVDDYLTKPFQVDELTVRLGNLIGRYDSRKAAQANDSDSDQTARFDEKWIRQLEKLVLENISNTNFLLADLADQLNMSKRSLYNKVVACTGMSPNQYVTEIRLNRARYLMETKTFETMAEVCYAVGFKTPHYFSKLMKERFGGETVIF